MKTITVHVHTRHEPTLVEFLASMASSGYRVTNRLEGHFTVWFTFRIEE